MDYIFNELMSSGLLHYGVLFTGGAMWGWLLNERWGKGNAILKELENQGLINREYYRSLCDSIDRIYEELEINDSDDEDSDDEYSDDSDYDGDGDDDDDDDVIFKSRKFNLPSQKDIDKLFDGAFDESFKEDTLQEYKSPTRKKRVENKRRKLLEGCRKFKPQKEFSNFLPHKSGYLTVGEVEEHNENISTSLLDADDVEYLINFFEPKIEGLLFGEASEIVDKDGFSLRVLVYNGKDINGGLSYSQNVLGIEVKGPKIPGCVDCSTIDQILKRNKDAITVVRIINVGGIALNLKTTN